jgi:hypothetical protein
MNRKTDILAPLGHGCGLTMFRPISLRLLILAIIAAALASDNDSHGENARCLEMGGRGRRRLGCRPDLGRHV